MCKFIGKSHERNLCKLSKSEISRLYSIVHVAMETTKTSHFTGQSKCFISIFFTCLDLANGIYSQTAKTVFSHLKLYHVYLEPFNSSNVMLYPCSNRERKICRSMSTSSIKRRIGRFHVVVVQWTSKKSTKKRDARAELLFC